MLDPRAIPPERVRPLRRTEFERLVELGAFDEDDRIELLEGVLVAMNPPGPAHASTVNRLAAILIRALAGRAVVSVQNPLVLSDESELEPDLAVVPPGDYDQAHPDRAWLVIEVAEAPLRKDREIKSALYARAGIPEYWIADLVAREVEVRKRPVAGTYSEVARHGRDPVLVPAQFPDVTLRVGDFMR